MLYNIIFRPTVLVFIIGIALLTALSARQSMAAPANIAGNGEYVVSLDQLKAAGFTGVTAVSATTSRFMLPGRYFRVKESMAPESGWGDAANIVSVLVRPKYSPDWSYNDGQIEIRDIGGRTQARATSANYYIVVTGPDQQKVAILAHDLQLAE